MATKTIGQLTQATTINNADEFAIEQSGVTKRVAASVVRGDIVNANIKSDAAIAFSKLSALNSAQILVGNGSNVPTAVSVTGDVTISNAGVTAIAAGAVVTADVADAAITPAKLSQPYTLATAKAFNWNGSSSNAVIDFESIPSWAKRITVMFNGVSTSGASDLIVRIGAGSFDTTGYASSFGYVGSTTFVSNITSGFGVAPVDASTITFGNILITTLGSNIWTYSSVLGRSTSAFVLVGGGARTLSGTLDRVRITTVSGTDTFDAGSINIAYEG